MRQREAMRHLQAMALRMHISADIEKPIFYLVSAQAVNGMGTPACYMPTP